MLSEKPHNQTSQSSFMPFTPVSRAVLQRKCACGTHTMGGGQCAECQKKMSVGGRPLQTKLAISEPSDAYEQEADRVAEQVMSMSPADVRERQNSGMTQPLVQRRATSNATGRAEAPPSVHDVLNSPGKPLDAATRAFFEPRFGQDFSHVRVHSGAAAEQSSRDVNASAYTVGHNIVFGAGRLAPGTSEGQRLIAHELTHVVQQSGPETVRVGQGGDKYSLSSVAPKIMQKQSVTAAIRAPGGRGPNRWLQRDQEPKTIGNRPGTATQLEATKKAAFDELKEIEANWMELRAPAVGFGEVAGWLTMGDVVIGLLRSHTELALNAIEKGDSALVKFMTPIVESDLVMYRFIAWHVAVYVNLLTLDPQMKDIAETFAADSRAFTDRADAANHVKLLRELAAAYRKKAPGWLKLVKILPAEVTRSSGNKITLTVTIAAHSDKSISELFVKETEAFIKDQSAIETLSFSLNQFFDTAFDEGLAQAAEAVVEFLSVRGGRRGGPKASKSGSKKKRDEKKGQKGKWGCRDVRCNVYPDPQANPPNKNCPERVIGEVPYIYPSFDAACKAAQVAANLLVPRGCIKRHCNCNTKCTKK